ncbi:MAG TPA: hypothetical protein VL595_05760 [Pseudonocardia sp.]|jgi:hypothetical protein|nr:hypothetical protein [Pseudonocardia sp.]
MTELFKVDNVLASPTPGPRRTPDGHALHVHEHELASGGAARVIWSRYYGASIHVHSHLSVVDKILAVRWATEALETHVLSGPSNDLTLDLASVAELPAVPAQRGSGSAVVALDELASGVARVECRDCPTTFHPDSSPHLDRCWRCAERVDGGRAMTGCILAALVLAPAPLTLVSPDIDRIASRVLLVLLAVAVFGWVVVQVIGALRFGRRAFAIAKHVDHSNPAQRRPDEDHRRDERHGR